MAALHRLRTGFNRIGVAPTLVVPSRWESAVTTNGQGGSGTMVWRVSSQMEKVFPYLGFLSPWNFKT
jgi:hypothetical protein